MTVRMGENKRELSARVGVISADGVLCRKLELALSGVAEVKRATYGSEGGFDLLLIDKRSRTLARESEGGAYAKSSQTDRDTGAPSEGGTHARAKSADVRAGGKVGAHEKNAQTGGHSAAESAVSDSGARAVLIIDRGEWHEGEASLPYPFSFRELRELVSGGSSAARLVIERDGRGVILDGEHIRLTEREHALLSAIAEGGGEFVGREELRVRAFGADAEGGILNVYIHYLREKLERSGEKLILSSRLGGYRIDEKYLGVKK